MADFFQVFSACFALLGFKMLFGEKSVTIGSVVLLACVSAAVGSAWTGGGGALAGSHLEHWFNTTLAAGMKHVPVLARFAENFKAD
jgi:hypothetical protein